MLKLMGKKIFTFFTLEIFVYLYVCIYLCDKYQNLMSWHNWFIIQDWMIILRMIKVLFLLIYLAASLYHLSELIVYTGIRCSSTFSNNYFSGVRFEPPRVWGKSACSIGPGHMTKVPL